MFYVSTDSYSHWADIPTSEGFHSVHNWEPPKVVLSEQLSIDKEPAKRQVNFLSAPESSIGSFQQHQEFIPQSSLIPNTYQDKVQTR